MLLLNFQYPQAGSNLCNVRMASADQTLQPLSVPSSRVEPLQPGVRIQGIHLWPTFSTLKPGRTSATAVSTHNGDITAGFQYPQAGSNLCNLLSRRRRSASCSLSVPSSRVEPLQLLSFDVQHEVIISFSTLKPGRTSATATGDCSHVAALVFQYPQAGSNLCNLAEIADPMNLMRLSVPSSRVEPLQPAISWTP